jgi:hypothetical protein
MTLSTAELEIEVARLRLQVQMRETTGGTWITEDGDEFDDSFVGCDPRLTSFL